MPVAERAANQSTAQAYARRAAKARRGISLLEVLVSIFILLFGILGVFSMMLAGKWHVLRANRYDRAATLGQAALNDIQVRGLLPALDSPMWITPGGVQAAAAVPLVFDPISTNAWNYPNPSAPIFNQRTLAQSIDQISGAVTQGFTTSLAADAVFQSRDDLVVEYPPDGDLPSLQPQQKLTAAPFSDLQRLYQGHYSWIFTVAPAATDLHNVSVAVFYKRDIAAEITVPVVDPLIGGMGGGEISFASAGIPLDGGRARQLRPGNWVLLSNTAEDFYKWYRIVTVDLNETASPVQYRIFVTGPDWPGFAAGTTTVSLFDSVVAVYEKTMSIEQPSQWGE